MFGKSIERGGRGKLIRRTHKMYALKHDFPRIWCQVFKINEIWSQTRFCKFFGHHVKMKIEDSQVVVVVVPNFERQSEAFKFQKDEYIV